MAKMMKRLIAAAITASMLTSVVAVPVFASEEEGGSFRDCADQEREW